MKNRHFLFICLAFITINNAFAQANEATQNEVQSTLPPEYSALKCVTKERAIEILFKDTDDDGVTDILDSEPNTPTNCPVDTRGISLDSDGDGVKDCDDQERFTEIGFPVDWSGIKAKVICYYTDYSACRKPEMIFLTNMYFDKKSVILRPQTQVILKLAANFLAKNSTSKLTIVAYSSKKEAKNLEDATVLAHNRAKAAVNFLVNYYAIDTNRLKISVKGYDDVQNEDDLYNRRIEIEDARN